MRKTDSVFALRDDLAEWLKSEIGPDGRVHVDDTDSGERFYMDLAETLMTGWSVKYRDKDE